MRFASIVGARPEFIRIGVVSKILRQQHEEKIIHTGQHYDYNMSAQFFQELDIPAPDYHLECGSGSHGAQTGRMLETIEQVLLNERFDGVIVHGDTNSTLAGALAAAKLHIPVAHVEAGLRSFNRTMPEEINRVMTDHLADWLFCPTENACVNLRNEGVRSGVAMVGDIMCDTLLQTKPKLQDRAASLLPKLGIVPQSYAVLTVHRAGNTDDPEAMRRMAQAINSADMPVIFPVHPRTRAVLDRYEITWQNHVQLIEPVGYIDMLTLQSHAHCVLTDSGGIQKEAFLLGVPCVTLREETEWIETLEGNWNVLVGTRPQDILQAINRPMPEPLHHHPFGQGDAAARIVAILTGSSNDSVAEMS